MVASGLQALSSAVEDAIEVQDELIIKHRAEIRSWH